MFIRRVHQWENVEETFLYLTLYSLLWVSNFLLGGMVRTNGARLHESTKLILKMTGSCSYMVCPATSLATSYY
jgi:hypothetical protein